MTIDEIIAKYGAQLATVNPILQQKGLPTYYQGNGVLHPDYEWENTPPYLAAGQCTGYRVV